MDADDCARIVEGVAAVLDLLAAGGDAVDDPAPTIRASGRGGQPFGRVRRERFRSPHTVPPRQFRYMRA